MSSGSLPTDWYVNRKLRQLKAAAALSSKNYSSKNAPLSKNSQNQTENFKNGTERKPSKSVSFSDNLKIDQSKNNKNIEDPYLLPQHPQNGHEIVWVNQSYNPNDFRTSVPVPRHKPMIISESYTPTESELLPHIKKADRCIVCSPFESTVATRCEDSTTLGIMLPTTGIPYKKRSSNWGTGAGQPPSLYNKKKVGGFHIVASPMTRYVDKMHHTNKLFKLH